MNAACYHGAQITGWTGMTSGDEAPPSRADSEALVLRAQAGEVAAFEALYRRHASRIYALCLRMAGNHREAEELTQDVFVRAWEKLTQFRGDSAFASWLHRLAVNVVIGTWRRRGRRRQRVVALEEAAAAADAAHRPRPRLAIDLERAIARLPAGARNVFVLHEIAGYRHHEIAAQTGLAVGTCKAQLHRARRLLREALKR